MLVKVNHAKATAEVVPGFTDPGVAAKYIFDQPDMGDFTWCWVSPTDLVKTFCNPLPDGYSWE